MVLTARRAVHGWLVLDKPAGITSTRALGIAKRILGAKKAGHAGTLDPLASGVLPLAFGEATKTVPFAMDGIKTYRFTVRWGIETETDDMEGAPTVTSEARPDAEAIRAALPAFVGDIDQMPPVFSAIKVAGRRAYDLARQGRSVNLEARRVSVRSLALIDCPDADHAVFETVCGKGTYVRSLARDLGRHLGTVAHVSTLRRLSVGVFSEADAISLELLEELGHKASALDDPAQCLLPVVTALDDIPALAIDGEVARRLKNGQSVIVEGANAPVISGTAYATIAGRLVALGVVDKGTFKPSRIFHLGG